MAKLITKLFLGHSKECEEVQNEKCDEIEVKVPKQVKEHKKKCLFSKEGALSASTDTRNGYLSSGDTIQITTQATIKTRSDDIGNVRLALLFIRVFVYIQNYIQLFARIYNVSEGRLIQFQSTDCCYSIHIKLRQWSYGSSIIPICCSYDPESSFQFQ